MKNICIIYQYDGSEFHGNQRQKNILTVSNLIEDIFLNIFDEKIHLINSGRTDKGVHAKMQVSNFIMKKDIKFDVIKYQIEKKSNNSIKILEIFSVNENFNSRYDVLSRTYEYILSKDVSPFERKYITKIDYDIDVDKLNLILNDYIGEYDFSYFSKKDSKEKNTFRKILEVYSIKKDKNIHIYIKGNAFLKTQIRIMVGVALKIYEGKIEKEFIKKALEGKCDKVKKYVASERGLYLYEVKLKDIKLT